MSTIQQIEDGPIAARICALADLLDEFHEAVSRGSMTARGRRAPEGRRFLGTMRRMVTCLRQSGGSACMLYEGSYPMSRALCALAVFSLHPENARLFRRPHGVRCDIGADLAHFARQARRIEIDLGVPEAFDYQRARASIPHRCGR